MRSRRGLRDCPQRLARWATTYYWDTSAGSGGSGVWNTTGAQNWGTTENSNSGLVNWSGSSSDTAEFYNGSGTVAVNGAQWVGNANFDAGTTYTLSGGTLNLGLNGQNGNLVNNGATTIAGAVVFGGVDNNFNSQGWLVAHQARSTSVRAHSLTNLSEADLGDTYGSTATINMSGGTVAVPWPNNNYTGVGVGMNGGTGVLTMTGNSVFDATANSATLNWQGVNVIQIGAGTDGSGHPSVGTVTVGGNSILRNGTGNGNANGYITVGESGGVGTLTISGSGLVQADNFYVGSQQGNYENWYITNNGASGGTGAVYLSGGTLAIGSFANDIGATGAIYFNGGVFQVMANGNGGIHANATLSAIVSTGGAVFNTNGYNYFVATGLMHDSGGSSPDGGLTKLGAGTLTLYATNTYTGPTTVSAARFPRQLGVAAGLQRAK